VAVRSEHDIDEANYDEHENRYDVENSKDTEPLLVLMAVLVVAKRCRHRDLPATWMRSCVALTITHECEAPHTHLPISRQHGSQEERKRFGNRGGSARLREPDQRDRDAPERRGNSEAFEGAGYKFGCGENAP
jgi:hypothetical protein